MAPPSQGVQGRRHGALRRPRGYLTPGHCTWGPPMRWSPIDPAIPRVLSACPTAGPTATAWTNRAPGPHTHRVGTAKTEKRPRQRPAQPPIRQLLGAADAQTNGTSHHMQHSPGTTTGLRERGNDTSKSTGRSGRRNMRRDERVTVQGPVKEQQPDGMSHTGRGHPCAPAATLPPLASSGLGFPERTAAGGPRQQLHAREGGGVDRVPVDAGGRLGPQTHPLHTERNGH